MSAHSPLSPDARDHAEALAARTLRGLTIDAVQAANSGHPGMPLGTADLATVLWSRFLKHDPADPAWPDRDRFVLSAGHGSMLLYGLLHLAGYDLPLEEIKNFRQLGSRTPGHPEVKHTVGVETTTGPLGQGIATAVGMAIAEAHLAAEFNTDEHALVDHYTYVVASDGDLMEGVSNEASSLAGHLGLGKLVVLWDDNRISIDGSTDLAFTEDVCARYRALGWHVVEAVDGHDREAVAAALEAARGVLDRPSLIACRTTIGFGSPNRAGTAAAHGEPLGQAEAALTKERLGIPPEPLFLVPDGAADALRARAFAGSEARCDWTGRLDAYREAHPEKAAEFERRLRGDLPEGWQDVLPTFEASAKGEATRGASGKVLGALVEALPELMGGSADLTPSNKTRTEAHEDFTATHPAGRYLRFGVREHAMGAILNGLTLHGGLRGYGGTFLIFSDYMKPAVRLAALMKCPTVFVYTHDSIGLGEDGPTHQPVEQLAGLRAIPHLWTIRPADAAETVEAWRLAIGRTDGPTALALTRQNVPTLDRTRLAPAEGARRGAYTLADAEGGRPDVLLLATGSEVHIALEAREMLAADGLRARVVSMPSWEVFEAQDEAYRRDVLPPSVRARVAVEAASPLGWGRYVGLEGAVVGLDRFGESAPYEAAYTHLGLTAEAVAEAARRVVQATREAATDEDARPVSAGTPESDAA
ncbi:MAG: transketolase [Rubricoccaceae bacterium]